MYCMYCNRPIPDEQEALRVVRKSIQNGIWNYNVSRHWSGNIQAYTDRITVIGFCCESCHEQGSPLIIIGKKIW